LPEDARKTKEIIRLCHDNEIETRLWWEKGCHKMPAFSKIPKANLENTEDFSQRYLGLPFHLFLPENYWQNIARILGLAKH
jgi:dTDP-4-amino-4,6-dideoxygalactose transaminase